MDDDAAEFPIGIWLPRGAYWFKHDMYIPMGVIRKMIFPVYEVSGLAKFTACMLTCRAFYFTSMYFVHQTVTILSARSLDRFLDVFRSEPPLLGRVTIITIRLDVSSREPLCNRICAMLMEFSRLLYARMRHVESFSIRFEDQLHERPGLGHIPEIPVQPLKALLEALPVTCISLEVDTAGFERYTGVNGTGHLCPTIARVMQQLRHLRIRLQRVCSMVLGAPGVITNPNLAPGWQHPVYPFLRTIVISLEIWSKITGGARYCNNPTEVGICLSSLLKPFRDGNWNTATQLPMHRLERLDIYSPVDLADHTIPGIRHSDVKNEKTYVMPYKRVPDLGDNNHEMLSWRCIRTGSVLHGYAPYVLGPFSAVRDVVEDSWRTTVHGTRLAVSRATGKTRIRNPEFYPYMTVWKRLPFENDLDGYLGFQRDKRGSYPQGTAWCPQILTIGEELQSRAFDTLASIPEAYLPYELQSKNHNNAKGLN